MTKQTGILPYDKLRPRDELAQLVIGVRGKMVINMLFKNGAVFIDNKFKKLDVRVGDDTILETSERLEPASDEIIIDCKNLLILPGLVEIHTHGCMGYDFSNVELENIPTMTDFYASFGITSVCATTMTMPKADYKKAMNTLKQAINLPVSGARIVGINMEGPFLGVDKKGAHDERYLEAPDMKYFEELDALSGGDIKLVDIDPCYESSTEFIRRISNTKTISLAHTSCDYKAACLAFDNGARNITHLFNAMNSLLHREPGLIGAFIDYAEKGVTAEIICDGIHIDPTIIRMMFRLCKNGMVLISDSMCAAGLSDGEYMLGGIPVLVKNGKATQENGTIAGSTSNVYTCMKNAVSYGVPLEQAINSASIIPAQVIRMSDKVGAIKQGLQADILILDNELDIKSVYIRGQKFK